MTIFDVIGGVVLLLVIAIAVIVGFTILTMAIDDLIVREEFKVGTAMLIYALVICAAAFYLLLGILPEFLKDVISRA